MARETEFQCRPGCAACCIAPSISSPISGMSQGKPAGVPCLQLDAQGLCKLFDQPARPDVCRRFKAAEQVCGKDSSQALRLINALEIATSPS